MPQQSFDVVVAGAIGIDTNVYLYGADVDWTVEGNFSEDIDCVGQAGGYTSRGFAALGCRTAFIGSVGKDRLAQWIRDELAEDAIETLLFDDAVGTHRSVNIMGRDGSRKNFFDGKGQMDVVPDLDACRALLRGSRLVHVHLENWCRHLLPIAREEGAVVSCDLQDVVRLDDPYRREFVAEADILFFSGANFPDPEEPIMQFLRERSGRVVVAGMGKRGAAVGTRAGIRYLAPPDTGQPLIDTNGAGDALAVGFLVGHVLDGMPVEDALLRGQIAARHTCALKATSRGLITRAQLDARFAALRGA